MGSLQRGKRQLQSYVAGVMIQWTPKAIMFACSIKSHPSSQCLYEGDLFPS